ncbi:Nitrogen assimilation transcription factor nit-4 [Tolypocladium capitatum]|uniref:Nitrogen assimilation transcription factor nit-4 n=1 Tax=Tolypocladium capitatum TaxID=45235 RepID=A0A2K3QPI3_9HYPO|nr:Nitrogen assimilation transcription factor nit-4 [Tolypocladium capitatum]
MNSRSFEGPMDWEYQDRGPFDPTSPFAQAANGASRNMFGSPFKSPSRPSNPPVNLATPSKSQPPPPQTSRFTPQLSSRNVAPPFRNPAFTTPRRPVDEVVLSEASGAEDSPALTEASDYPNDTPEADHWTDANMGGAIVPLRIDKATRYGRSGLSLKKHASGKGEIRIHRDLSVGARKRKRHNYDRDVGSLSRHHHAQDSDTWDSDSDTSVPPRTSKRSQGKDEQSQAKGTFELFFHFLNKYPNAPDHMQRWMQFGANLFLVSVVAYLGWSVVSTVRSDIYKANEIARQELMSKMTECQSQYRMNECAKKDRPALRVICEEWHDCMMQNPESILRVKVTAKQVAEIINEFSEAMHLKAWGVVLAFILVCTTVNVGSLGRQSGHKPATSPPAQTAGAAHDTGRSPDITPGYMLVPVQTPRMQRRAMLDEGTDTDSSPLNMKPELTHYTPSGRRSPTRVTEEAEVGPPRAPAVAEGSSNAASFIRNAFIGSSSLLPFFLTNNYARYECDHDNDRWTNNHGHFSQIPCLEQLDASPTAEHQKTALGYPRGRPVKPATGSAGFCVPMETDGGSSQTPSGPSQASTGNTPQTAASASQPAQSHRSTPGQAQASGSSKAGAQSSKRRRGLGVVTPNACTECRKKRAKCDGGKPCSRCKSQKDVECVYEIPVRQSKENLRSEIENLRHRQRSSDVVFSALVRPDLWEEVLRRLRGGQPIGNISEWLGGMLPSGAGALPAMSQRSDRDTSVGPSSAPVAYGGGLPGPKGPGLDNVATRQPGMRSGMGQNSPWHFSSHSQAESTPGNSHPDAMSWAPTLLCPAHSRVGSWAESMQTDQTSDGLPRFRGLEQVLSPLNEPEMGSPAETWTTVTGDINLVQHLLALYFCWEYPTFASLSKEHFLRDFQDGRHRYCSPILVNALLALGCRFSTQPMTRANPNDPYSSGDHFFKESQRLFYQETDHHSLTTIQALGIMSIREASCGRDSESWYYAGQSIRLAIEMGLHRIHDEGDEDELAVQSATFWGAFALDHAWSLATGSLPQCSCFPHLPPKPAIIGDIEASLWVPYTDDGAPLQRSCEQPSNVRSVYKCFCELSELVHQSLYILHSPGTPLSARDLLSIYTQYLNWYDRIPEVLRLGHNFTPAVLFAQPLIELCIIGSKVSPRDVCSQAADAIQGLLTSYSQLYTLQRTPSFVPYFVLTSTIMHLTISSASLGSDPAGSAAEKMRSVVKTDPHVSEALKQGIADLTDMVPCHHFAEQALNILRYLAKKWNIDVDMDGGDVNLNPEEYDRLVRPYTSSLNFFAPSVGSDDFGADWGGGRVLPEDAPQAVEKAAESMENPLFWPFPMQGRPMLPTGKELEQAGFALL